MSGDLRGQLLNNLNLKETDELVEIWRKNDHNEWSDLAFDVIREILVNRLGELPLQAESSVENIKQNYNVKTWWQLVREKFNQYPILFVPAVLLLFIIFPITGNAFPYIRNTWKKIPPPPAKPYKLLGTAGSFSGYGDLFILAEDKKIYSFDISGKGRWSLASLKDVKENTPCELSAMEFFVWKKPFSDSFECSQGDYYIGDSPAIYYDVVLDQDGTIWSWIKVPPSLPLKCTLPLCASTGLFLGLLLFLIKYRKLKEVNPSSGSGDS